MGDHPDGYASGPIGQGGQRPVTFEFHFEGQLGQSFVDFAAERARRLSLNGTIQHGETDVLVTLSGPEALLGAFETACCIGPDDSTVDGWTARSTGQMANTEGVVVLGSGQDNQPSH